MLKNKREKLPGNVLYQKKENKLSENKRDQENKNPECNC